MKFLLDTDTCIFALRHRPGILGRMQAMGPDALAVSAMNEAELWYGALNSQHPEKHLKDVQAFLAPFQVLPFDGQAAWEHARLRKALKANPIGERDLVIAAVAAAHHLTVVTHNQREFGRIPGLAAEDWAEG